MIMIGFKSSWLQCWLVSFPKIGTDPCFWTVREGESPKVFWVWDYWRLPQHYLHWRRCPRPVLGLCAKIIPCRRTIRSNWAFHRHFRMKGIWQHRISCHWSWTHPWKGQWLFQTPLCHWSPSRTWSCACPIEEVGSLCISSCRRHWIS